MTQIKLIITPLLGIFISIYAIYIGYIYFNQSDMLFMQISLPKNYRSNFENSFEEKFIPSFDGAVQHGLLFKVSNPKGIIFYLHGNAGNVSSWGNISQFYCSLGYDLFVLDYRSFGKSEGIIESESKITKDVNIVFDQVTKSYSKKMIIGYSIGTGIAAQLASIRNSNLLILQAPYYNLLRLTESKVPYFPNALKKFQFETNKNLQKIKCPIYIFHGEVDPLIELENSNKLQKLFKPQDSLFILAQQGHVGINDNPDFQNRIKEILK